MAVVIGGSESVWNDFPDGNSADLVKTKRNRGAKSVLCLYYGRERNHPSISHMFLISTEEKHSLT